MKAHHNEENPMIFENEEFYDVPEMDDEPPPLLDEQYRNTSLFNPYLNYIQPNETQLVLVEDKPFNRTNNYTITLNDYSKFIRQPIANQSIYINPNKSSFIVNNILNEQSKRIKQKNEQQKPIENRLVLYNGKRLLTETNEIIKPILKLSNNNEPRIIEEHEQEEVSNEINQIILFSNQNNITEEDLQYSLLINDIEEKLKYMNSIKIDFIPEYPTTLINVKECEKKEKDLINKYSMLDKSVNKLIDFRILLDIYLKHKMKLKNDNNFIKKTYVPENDNQNEIKAIKPETEIIELETNEHKSIKKNINKIIKQLDLIKLDNNDDTDEKINIINIENELKKKFKTIKKLDDLVKLKDDLINVFNEKKSYYENINKSSIPIRLPQDTFEQKVKVKIDDVINKIDKLDLNNIEFKKKCVSVELTHIANLMNDEDTLKFKYNDELNVNELKELLKEFKIYYDKKHKFYNKIIRKKLEIVDYIKINNIEDEIIKIIQDIKKIKLSDPEMNDIQNKLFIEYEKLEGQTNNDKFIKVRDDLLNFYNKKKDLGDVIQNKYKDKPRLKIDDKYENIKATVKFYNMADKRAKNVLNSMTIIENKYKTIKDFKGFRYNMEDKTKIKQEAENLYDEYKNEIINIINSHKDAKNTITDAIDYLLNMTTKFNIILDKLNNVNDSNQIITLHYPFLINPYKNPNNFNEMIESPFNINMIDLEDKDLIIDYCFNNFDDDTINSYMSIQRAVAQIRPILLSGLPIYDINKKFFEDNIIKAIRQLLFLYTRHFGNNEKILNSSMKLFSTDNKVTSYIFYNKYRDFILDFSIFLDKKYGYADVNDYPFLTPILKFDKTENISIPIDQIQQMIPKPEKFKITKMEHIKTNDDILNSPYTYKYLSYTDFMNKLPTMSPYSRREMSKYRKVLQEIRNQIPKDNYEIDLDDMSFEYLKKYFLSAAHYLETKFIYNHNESNFNFKNFKDYNDDNFIVYYLRLIKTLHNVIIFSNNEQLKDYLENDYTIIDKKGYGIKLKNKSNNNKLNIIEGEIAAGNDAKELKEELKKLIKLKINNKSKTGKGIKRIKKMSSSLKDILKQLILLKLKK